jgi:hypothetical protein
MTHSMVIWLQVFPLKDEQENPPGPQRARGLIGASIVAQGVGDLDGSVAMPQHPNDAVITPPAAGRAALTKTKVFLQQDLA